MSDHYKNNRTNLSPHTVNFLLALGVGLLLLAFLETTGLLKAGLDWIL